MITLYQSEYFKFSQCDVHRCFWFETENKTVNLSFCQLLDLRNKVNSINLLPLFDLEENHNDLEILCFCNREHLLLLDLHQILDLKKCISTIFMVLQGQQNTLVKL